MFENVKDSLDYRENNTTDCWQANLEKPTPISSQRQEFWNNYQAKGIDYIMKKYGTVSLQTCIKNKVLKLIGGQKVTHLCSNVVITLTSLEGGQHDGLVAA